MPFPSVLPDVLTPDAILAGALTLAISGTQLAFSSSSTPSRAAISIATIDESTSGPTTFRYAGIRDTEMHYSGSLPKVVAMYGAFELRQTATIEALTAGDCDAGVLFPQIATALDTQIKAAGSLIPPGQRIAPKWASMFDSQGLASGGCVISFKRAFLNSIRGMIEQSNNNDASATIQKLGFSWINGLMEKTGLFDATTKNGLWLAGTFTGALPAVRVPSVNDGPSAQALTTRHTALLYAHIFRKLEVDARGPDSICDEMISLLAGNASWLTATFGPGGHTGLSSDFAVTHAKVGDGPLNAGGVVASEASAIRHIPTGQQFIVAWQNVLATTAELNALVFLVERTMLNILGIP